MRKKNWTVARKKIGVIASKKWHTSFFKINNILFQFEKHSSLEHDNPATLLL
jgi:hypothetical protein